MEQNVRLNTRQRDTGLRHRLCQRGEILVLGIRVQGQGGHRSTDLPHLTGVGSSGSQGSGVYFRVWSVVQWPTCEGCMDKGGARKLLEKVDSSEETGSLLYLSKNVFRRFNCKTLMVAKGLDREKMVLLLRLWCDVQWGRWGTFLIQGEIRPLLQRPLGSLFQSRAGQRHSAWSQDNKRKHFTAFFHAALSDQQTRIMKRTKKGSAGKYRVIGLEL